MCLRGLHTSAFYGILVENYFNLKFILNDIFYVHTNLK